MKTIVARKKGKSLQGKQQVQGKKVWKKNSKELGKKVCKESRKELGKNEGKSSSKEISKKL